MIFLVPFLLTLFLTPLAISWGRRFLILDFPKADKIHLYPVPRLGGLVLFASFVSGVFLSYPLFDRTFLGIFLGSFLIVGLGFWDDLKGVSPFLKLSGQIIIGLLVIFSGLKLEFLSPWGELLSIFLIVACCNGMNLLDGLDGLAAGLGAIISLGFLGLFFLESDPLGLALSLTVLGSCLGFLVYNFHPARIFLGDSGSQFLGYIFAVLALLAIIPSESPKSIAVSLLLVGILIWETLYTFLRRVKNGTNIFQSDLCHLYNRLIDKGVKYTETVFVYYLLGGLGVLAGLLITLNWSWIR